MFPTALSVCHFRLLLLVHAQPRPYCGARAYAALEQRRPWLSRRLVCAVSDLGTFLSAARKSHSRNSLVYHRLLYQMAAAGDRSVCLHLCLEHSPGCPFLA